MAFLVSTTSNGPVLLKDLGYTEIIPDPTINLDLMALGFTIEEINNSESLKFALGNNPTPKLTATYNGDPVNSTFNIFDDKLDKNNNLSELTDLNQARSNLGLGSLAVQNFIDESNNKMFSTIPARDNITKDMDVFVWEYPASRVMKSTQGAEVLIYMLDADVNSPTYGLKTKPIKNKDGNNLERAVATFYCLSENDI